MMKDQAGGCHDPKQLNNREQFVLLSNEFL